MKIESKNTTNVRFSVISDLTENILNETVRPVIKCYQMQKKVVLRIGGTGKRTCIIWESQSKKADCWFYNMIFFENHCGGLTTQFSFCKKDFHFSGLKGFPFFHENTFHSRSVRGSRWTWPNPFDSRTSDLANFLSLSHLKISFQGFFVSQHESGKTSSQKYKGFSFLSIQWTKGTFFPQSLKYVFFWRSSKFWKLGNFTLT